VIKKTKRRLEKDKAKAKTVQAYTEEADGEVEGAVNAGQAFPPGCTNVTAAAVTQRLIGLLELEAPFSYKS
jgi:hypothetical protein